MIALSCAALLTPMAATTASAANGFEWNYTTNGDGDGYEKCTSRPGSNPGGGISGCFHAVGDKFWVSDHERDGLSASLYWYNYNSDGSLYRHGACVEKRGVNENGWCNKNFREGSVIKVKLCFLDLGAPDPRPSNCGDLSRAFES